MSFPLSPQGEGKEPGLETGRGLDRIPGSGVGPTAGGISSPLTKMTFFL